MLALIKTVAPGSQDGPPIFALETMVLKQTPTDNDNWDI